MLSANRIVMRTPVDAHFPNGMIIKRTAQEASFQFAKWASLFQGNIFVNLIAYADDSGTHDEHGKQPGSEAPVFGGYIGDIKDWKLFCWRWQSVLNNYKVPYFHYREFSNRAAAKNPSNPYHKWSETQRDAFLFELAAIAGAQVPVGGMVNLKSY